MAGKKGTIEAEGASKYSASRGVKWGFSAKMPLKGAFWPKSQKWSKMTIFAIFGQGWVGSPRTWVYGPRIIELGPGPGMAGQFLQFSFLKIEPYF